MKSPDQQFRNDQPYKGYGDYLTELNVLLDVLLLDYLKGETAEKTRLGKASPGDFYFEPVAYLEGRLLREGLEEPQNAEAWKQMMDDRLDVTRSMSRKTSLQLVEDRLHLSESGSLVLALAFRTAIDPGYQRIFSFLHRDREKRYPTLSLAGQILNLHHKSGFEVYKELYEEAVRYRILFPELADAEDLMNQMLVCDERLQDILLEEFDCLPPNITFYDEEPEEELFFREQELAILQTYEEQRFCKVMVLCGAEGSGKRHLLHHFLWQRESAIAFVDVSSYGTDGQEGWKPLLKNLQYAVRECLLWGMALGINGIETFSKELQLQLLRYLETEITPNIPEIFVCTEDEEFQIGVSGVYVLKLSEFDEIKRIAIWKYYGEACRFEADVVLEEVANTFAITPGQIKRSLEQAKVMAGGSGEPMKRQDLYHACYIQLKHKLGEKTSKVKPAFSWEDLKLAEPEKRIIGDICACMRNRHTVLSQWNFSKVVPYGAGITALFAGPPGTGKTMAAQVIANELQMELYKIDLSQLMDKYVGETEKNIKQIFDQAQKSNSILFFDEADAIFNKRLEASDSNERFANIESSLLLQCIEEYRGISILATNNFNAIDGAFVRRFKYYILFREPDEAMRYEIWKSVFPKVAPLSEDVDLHLLAHMFEFTGAIIKNVALAAAYLAADKGKPISVVDILLAIKREMNKTNLILSREKLGSLGYLFDELV